MNEINAKSYILNKSPEAFLARDKNGTGFVCPRCGNGTGGTGDGLYKKDKYICDSCQFEGDIFDLIAIKFKLHNFEEQLQKAAEIFNIKIENEPICKENDVNISENTIRYLKKCKEEMPPISIFSEMGISYETINQLNLGFDSTNNEFIIPISKESYETINVTDDSNLIIKKHGQNKIFNGSILIKEKQHPIFILERSIDAISIIQCGGQAISLGSASNYELLLNALNYATPAKPLIIAFKNSPELKKATDSLIQGLNERNVPFIVDSDISNHFPNSINILNQDTIKNDIKNAENRTSKIKSPIDIATEIYNTVNAAKSLTSLKSFISQNSRKPILSTGLKSIDKALDGGINSGLYIIGAISSLGKTTLTLQIADSLAKAGHDVLFFSLEQSHFELMCKSISRESYIYCIKNYINAEKAKSNLAIISGKKQAHYGEHDQKVIDESFNNYAKYSEHISIYDNTEKISVSYIREAVKNHILYTKRSHPIVFIDYLQILKSAKGDDFGSDKTKVDHIVTELKHLSRDFDIPVIAVSSLNRCNYSSEINMAAFKESGAIEYGSDVLIGLQLKGVNEKDFNVNKAKAKFPREIELCILKNRNGSITSDPLSLNYYTTFNCFEDPSDPIIKQDIKEDYMIEGFIEISPESEDYSCPF